MKKDTNISWSVVTIVALPLIGFGITYGLAHIAPVSENTPVYNGLFTLFLILSLLAVPYGMVKLLGHVAHLRNPDEKEIRLKDVAKDKQQFDRSQANR